MTADAPIELVSRSEEQTVQIGRALARSVEPSSIITLEGELGSGKTRLTWGIAEGLGIDRRAVSSPTFAIVHDYPGSDGVRLIHADAYRVDESESDDLETLLGIGADDGWVAVIEWPSRIEAMLPLDRVRVTMRHDASGGRSIRVKASSQVIDRLRTLMEQESIDG